MAAAQAAGAGNAVGLERADGRGERFNAEQMRAVGSGTRGELGMAVEQERDIAALNDGGDGFGAVDQRALVGRFKAKQEGRDIARLQDRAEVAQERRRVAERRRDEIEARGARRHWTTRVEGEYRSSRPRSLSGVNSSGDPGAST